MGKKATSGIMLPLLLTSMLTLAFNIQTAKASGTIYIRADGSVDPPTAPIQRDGNIYTFTGNITEPIAIEKDDIIIDGNGHTLQGGGAHEAGLDLSIRNNVTIRGAKITEFWIGIMLSHSGNVTLTGNHVVNNTWAGVSMAYSSGNTLSANLASNNYLGIYVSDESKYNELHGNIVSNNTLTGIILFLSSNYNTVSENQVSHNYRGIVLGGSRHNTVYGNVVFNNSVGILLAMGGAYYSIDNMFYHNNFFGNLEQVRFETGGYQRNTWDDGYPSGGNHWSDHVTVDDHSGINQDEPGSDGIVDEPYFIGEDNQDNYPLINPWVEREVGVRVGDWAKYVVETVGQHVPPEFKNVDWIRNIVQDVSNTTLLVEQSWHYKNGTEKTVTGYGNVVTSDSEMCVYFISKGLNPGDTVYATYPNENLPGLTKINETISRECLGVNRETNHVNTTYRGTGYDAYWDRATGIMVEVKMSHLDTLLHLEIVETNLWGAPPTASATIDMDPDTLNLRSKGQWITVYIQLPEKYNAADINATTILLNETISPVLDPKYEFVTSPSEYLVDHDEDGILERMVKFDTTEVMALLRVGEATLTITGEVNDISFEGSDNIRVILPSTGCGGCRGFKR